VFKAHGAIELADLTGEKLSVSKPTSGRGWTDLLVEELTCRSPLVFKAHGAIELADLTGEKLSVSKPSSGRGWTDLAEEEEELTALKATSAKE
jgi:hypothetical protein